MIIDSKTLLTFIEQKDKIDTAVEEAALAFYEKQNGRELNERREGVSESNQPCYSLVSWQHINGTIWADFEWCHQSAESASIGFPASDLWS